MEVEILLSSKPGEAKLFTFMSGKTVYVNIKEGRAGNVILTPKLGTASSLWTKTKRGEYPLINNVTRDDIASVSLTALDIPATNPDAFLKIFSGASLLSFLSATENPHTILKRLIEKWHPARNQTEGAEAVYNLIKQIVINNYPLIVGSLK